MEKNIDKIDMLDRFVENERRSKMWTIISVVIFCLLGLLVFFLAYELNKSNAKYAEQNEKLKATQKELDAALEKLAQRNESLQGDSVSLTNKIGNFDSLKKAYDTLALLFNKSQSNFIDSGAAVADSRIKELYERTFSNHRVVASDNLKKSILKPDRPHTEENPVYTIYMQCMPGYEKLTESLVSRLKQKKYIVPGIETIQKFSFNPIVKYFYNEDKNEADRIASLINESDDYFKKNPVKIQQLNVKSPSHQIEVWIGQYQAKDFNKLIRQSSRLQQQIKQ